MSQLLRSFLCMHTEGRAPRRSQCYAVAALALPHHHALPASSLLSSMAGMTQHTPSCGRDVEATCLRQDLVIPELNISPLNRHHYTLSIQKCTDLSRERLSDNSGPLQDRLVVLPVGSLDISPSGSIHLANCQLLLPVI